jgi:hypothetical protein
LRFHVTPLTVFSATEGYYWNGSKHFNYGDDYIYSPEDRALNNDDYSVNKVSATLDHTFTSDFNASVQGIYQIKRYDNEAFSERYDEDTITGLIQVNKIQSRKLSWGVNSQYVIYDRGDSHGKIDDRIPEVDNGVSYWITGLQASFDIFGDTRFVLKGRAGYNYLTYEADEIKNDDMIGDSSVELAIHQNERTRGLLGFRVGKTQSDIFPYSSQDDSTVYGSVSTILGRTTDTRVGVDAEYRTRSYDLVTIDPEAANAAYWTQWVNDHGYRANGDRDSIYVRVWANHKFTDNFVAAIFYSFEDVDSDVDTSYTENIFGASVTVKFL